MNAIVFGATGGTGKSLLSQLLERFSDQKHQITVFAREPGKVSAVGSNLRTVQGDVLDYEAVEQAVAGQDVVFVCLGVANPRDRSGLRTNGTANIIRAMEATGVARIICLSAFGVGDSRGDLPFLHKYVIVPLILKHVYVDHGSQEAILRRSNLDWTIVRPGALTDTPRTGSYWHGLRRDRTPLSAKIARADVADFMIGQTADDTYLRQAPILSYRR